MTTIALIGAPGAGKSTVGAVLAARLGLNHVDVDAEIERRSGRAISDIFAIDGEPAFRELERDVTLEFLGQPGVVSLGGGAPLTPEIGWAVWEANCVWLHVSVDEAVERIADTDHRPLLNGHAHERLAALMDARTHIYAAVARHIVDTDGRDPDDIAAEIAALVGAS